MARSPNPFDLLGDDDRAAIDAARSACNFGRCDEPSRDEIAADILRTRARARAGHRLPAHVWPDGRALHIPTERN